MENISENSLENASNRQFTAPGGENEPLTGTEIDTPLTQACSPDVRAPDYRDILDHMRTIRREHGADTPVGHRCSNIIEILEGLPRHPSEWIDYLMPDWVPQAWDAAAPALARQMADYRRLMS